VDRVAVLIPYRKSEDEERQRNVELVTDTWWAFLQSLPIAGNVLVSDGATRGEALMAGAREADRQTADVQGDPITVLILAEPGMLPPVTVVEGAIGRVLEDPLTVVQVAHSTRWLTREQTTDLRITAGAHTPNPVYDAGPPTDHLLSLQGCVVIAADTFRRAGGFDPRFTGRTGHEEGCLELCLNAVGATLQQASGVMLRLFDWERDVIPPLIDADVELVHRYLDRHGTDIAPREVLKVRAEAGDVPWCALCGRPYFPGAEWTDVPGGLLHTSCVQATAGSLR
jgi:hypothetical protein